MNFKSIAGVVLSGALLLSPLAMVAQTAGQDMKDAGHSTKNATVDAGHGISKGTKKGYHKTKHETKKAYHKTTRGTRNLGRRIEGKPTLPNNPQ